MTDISDAVEKENIDVDKTLKKAETLYLEACKFKTEADNTTWPEKNKKNFNALYTLEMALYEQNRVIIELLRQQQKDKPY